MLVREAYRGVDFFPWLTYDEAVEFLHDSAWYVVKEDSLRDLTQVFQSPKNVPGTWLGFTVESIYSPPLKLNILEARRKVDGK